MIDTWMFKILIIKKSWIWPYYLLACQLGLNYIFYSKLVMIKEVKFTKKFGEKKDMRYDILNIETTLHFMLQWSVP